MKYVFDKKTVYVIGAILLILGFAFGLSFAMNYANSSSGIRANIVKIDEEAFGNAEFNSDYYELSPIMDETIIENNQNVIKFGFRVGGAKENDADNIIYDVSLAELEIDCNLLSPYLKWRLYKNGEIHSEGSFDYKFDTIKNGRLVLTSTQQDLKGYSEDRTTYDQYDLYIWLSDSCQENDLLSCLDSEAQNNLTGRSVKGRINIELRTGTKKELVRNPSDTLDITSCINEMETEEHENR